MTACVLIIDDIESNVKVLKAKLEKEYYTVLSALNGKEGLRIAKESQPDLILLDVMMPEMDGFEVCEHLKSNFSTENIPIIFITALDDMESRIRGLNYGVEDFLSKPINDIALFARIKSLSRLKMFSDELSIRSSVSKHIDSNSDLLSVKNDIRDLSNASIAVIGDDDVESEQICNYLREEFDKVVIYGDNLIEELNDVFVGQSFDLIIINMQSVMYDGLRLSSQLRSKKDMKNVPILILIDEDDTDNLIKGMDIGINDYITIPVNQHELLARSRLQLKKKKYYDALYSSVVSSMEMAIIDPLTKCYNRFYLDTHLKQKIANVRKNDHGLLSLIIFDLDFFKKVNDKFGHLIGDELLKKVSHLVRENIRASDLLARFGGEEFIILLPDTSAEEAVMCAERISTLIADKDFGGYKITVSVGVTCLCRNDNVKTLLRRVDKNLYKAKNSGRNKVIFT